LGDNRRSFPNGHCRAPIDTCSPPRPLLSIIGYRADYPVLVSLSDFPVGITLDMGGVRGILLRHLTRSQRAKIDDFEGETYKVASIVVTIESSDKEVDADVYMWAGDGGITGEP
jgi:Gamma-glutamyl cyclotransferase, AIG2-like